MRKLHCCLFVFTLILLAGVQPALQAQTAADSQTAVEKRMADLEKQLVALQSEIADLKAKEAAAPAVNAAVATSEAKPTSNPLSGITSVLGGATVTGLVDGYYTYNTNQPSNHGYSPTSFFSPRSNQFGLSLLELGLVKTPTADSRLGYNITFGFGEAMNVVNASGGDSVNFSAASRTGGYGFGFAQNLKEGYFSYLAPIGKGLQIDVGKFVTPAAPK